MQMFIVLVVTFIVVFILQSIFEIWRLNNYVKHVPLIPWSIFKNFVFLKKTTVDVFKYGIEALELYNGIAKVYIGPKLMLICDNPENMKLILTSKECMDKTHFYHFVSAVGKGLFTSNGARWQTDRKHINRIFSLSILKSFVPIFNRHFGRLTKNLERKCDQPEFDIALDLISSIFDVVCDTNFRLGPETMIPEKTKYIDCVSRMWNIAGKRLTSVIMFSDFLFRFTKLHSDQRKILDHSNKFAKQITNLYESSAYAHELKMINDDGSERKPTILLEKLLEMKRQGITDESLMMDQINTFIIAGSDTTSITSINILLMLAMHPNVQDRIYEEIDAHMLDNDINSLDYETINKLDYMERAIKETMRLFPIAYVIMRQASAKVQLNECVAPEGAYLMMNIYKLHRNKEVWGETADEFEPDRFLPDAMADRHPFAYIPFLAGLRNCIGSKYAMISMKMMLCHLLTAYTFTTSLKMSDIVLEFDGMLKMANPCMVKVTRRR